MCETFATFLLQSTGPAGSETNRPEITENNVDLIHTTLTALEKLQFEAEKQSEGRAVLCSASSRELALTKLNDSREESLPTLASTQSKADSDVNSHTESFCGHCPVKYT